MTAGILRVTVRARRLWNNIFNMPNDSNSQPGSIYLTKASFMINMMKTFSDKQKWRKFTTERCLLKEVLNEAL